jgi:hypothetical protein
VLVVALLLAALGGAYWFSQAGDETPPPTPGATTSAAPSTATTAPTSQEPSPTSEPSATPTTEPTTAATSTTTTTTTTTTATSGPQTDQALAKFVRDYFKNVTGDRDTTWAQLTPRMQASMGGRGAYDGFWSTIDSVKVGDLRADAGAGTVDVKLTYQRKGGGSSVENHQLAVVEDGDSFLIDSDSRA